MSSSAYGKLAALSKELQIIGNTQGLLSWDQEVNLAKKGVAYRAEQLAYFSGEVHKKSTSEQVGEWIDTAESESLDELQTANVKEWKRGFQRDTCLPVELVQRFAEARALAHESWAEAREASDFGKFREPLTELIDLCKEKVSYWGFNEVPYDGLLDIYERGASVTKIDQVFDDFKTELIPLVEEACSREPFKPAALNADYPVEQQQAFNQRVADSIGFDFDAGRIDTAVHPFCTGLGPMDTRLTTRYDTADFRSSLFGVLHEAGHGLYDQGLDKAHHGTPCGNAVSLGVHESQSRLWENHVGRSNAFWQKWLPVAAEYFPNLSKLSVEDMYKASNQAENTFIRVEADEVTYDLHIILRYEIEKAIFSGDLAIDDIPDAWNEKVKQSFGLEVDKAANGCLQDIHWSMGGFGYFPTYSLGNLNASHLVAAACEDSELLAQMDQANYQPLLEWMRKRIHVPGSLHAPDDLITAAAGSPVSPKAHIEHLRSRYLAG